MRERSIVGAQDRQYRRLYPIVLCLETLCKINEWQLSRKSFPDGAFDSTRLAVQYPPLYSSGVYYEEEPPGEEEWLDIPSLYKQGFGDCEDLACARVGELRHRGIAAVPVIKSKTFKITDVNGSPTTLTLVHVMTLWPDGAIEDPSRRLGMQGEYS
jgi:hypothetical protein